VLVYWVFALVCLAQAQLDDQVLRYRTGSCNTLEPVYVTENWQFPGGDTSVTDEDEALLNRPRRSRDRSPPFSLSINFNQYRRGREYTVELVALTHFDSFMLQARAAAKRDGNATLVGSFETIPAITTKVHCLGKRKSSVTDKGRPVKLSNMTFTWRAPPNDYGSVRFVASIVAKNEYHLIETEQITFNSFPVSIRGCGSDMSCFRECSSSPICPPDESNYMVVMYLSRDKSEVVISMGGIVEDDTKYIALGFGDDKMAYQSMDVSACYRDGNKIILQHYLIENKLSHPFLHRAPLKLDGSDIDTSTNFIWCQFKRPINPDGIWELDLSQPMYHFYFHGDRNNSNIYLPKMTNMWDSGPRRNFSKIINEISFSGGVRGVYSPGCSLQSFLPPIFFSFLLIINPLL